MKEEQILNAWGRLSSEEKASYNGYQEFTVEYPIWRDARCR